MHEHLGAFCTHPLHEHVWVPHRSLTMAVAPWGPSPDAKRSAAARVAVLKARESGPIGDHMTRVPPRAFLAHLIRNGLSGTSVRFFNEDGDEILCVVVPMDQREEPGPIAVPANATKYEVCGDAGSWLKFDFADTNKGGGR